MKLSISFFAISLFGLPAFADYTVEKLDEGPPVEEIAAGIAKELSPNGFTVKRSETSTLCNIWFCKQWDVDADFKATAGVLYPFKPGQLIGVIQYKRRGGDFRDQDINRGVYTLRYSLQPVDGNHEGTSRTRDFLLVLNAEQDKSPEVMDIRKMYTASAEAAESSHPGLLQMQAVPEDADAKSPSIRANDDDWSIVRLFGTAKAGDQTNPLVLDVVVVGHADE